ncbi:unnamed protein product, partial [Ectocarpus sp. 13 AM-2016]
GHLRRARKPAPPTAQVYSRRRYAHDLAPVQGNGLRALHSLPGREISRVRHACVAQPAEADWRQEVPTLLCYFGLPDPTGKTNGDSIQKIHYIHEDGSKSIDRARTATLLALGVTTPMSSLMM